MIEVSGEDAVESQARFLDLRAPVSGLAWIGERACFALGDGRIAFVNLDGSGTRAAVDDAAILSAVRSPCGTAIITGDDAGVVRRTYVDGASEVLGTFAGSWIDHVAASPESGLIAAAAGKEVAVWTRGAQVPSHRFTLDSTVGGLAFDGKGKRLAVAHYGGASLYFAMSPQSRPMPLEWKGSHIAITIAARADYVVTGTQELGLHGWRLPGREDMAMSGYVGKTRSFSWNRKGTWLATSGDTSAVIWPFEGKTGPMGKQAQLLAPSTFQVTRVAFHPAYDVLAVGYADGAVVLAQLHEDMFVPVAAADQSAISALEWDDSGRFLAWGSEDGNGGMLDMRKAA
jgi:WD40 repeat protein